MKTITRTATAFDAQGYIQNHGVEICDFGDTISIGASEFRKDELEITAYTITHKGAGWSVTW